MNQIIKKKNKNSFFFFVDCLKDFENKYFKINNFFINTDFLFPNKYFSVFLKDKIDFDFLDKNEKLVTFFFIFNKFFFKNQITKLKVCLINEHFLFNSLKQKLNITFFLNFYFYFRYIYTFTFILKKKALKIKI